MAALFQSFESTADGSHGAARLALLRAAMARAGLAGYLVPRSDAHMGEYVAPCDARLEWLTGFSGSAGFCVVLMAAAGVFVDGRYRTQVKGQVDLAAFTPVDWPETTGGAWIAERLQEGDIGYDPWLHTRDELAAIEAALAGRGLRLRSVTGNLIDSIWADRPAPPMAQVFAHPDAVAGEAAAQKSARLAGELRAAGHGAAVITLPDSLCWLLNIRGGDVPRNPVMQGFGILHGTGEVALFASAAKFDAATRAGLGSNVTLHAPQDFAAALTQLAGPVRLDPGSAPMALAEILRGAGCEIAWAEDPTRLPKARKNAAELDGMRRAHLRDGAAVVEFLHWLDTAAQNPALTEIDIVTALEGFRAATGALHDISFETICGAGPNGAIIHYRVTEASNRAIGTDTLLLLDSGGQYRDGTTDITRTLAIGEVGDAARAAYTRVLQGLIAMSRARWPIGLAGRDLDALARAPLWQAGQDYNHGTGHGVGAFLSVHEGPQRLSRLSEVPLEAGMILSNEPGYYREGEYGIRLENLIAVQPAPRLVGGDDARLQLCFETLTFAPFDKRLILTTELSRGERDWLNVYHAEVLAKLAPRLSPAALIWCHAACAPL